ILVSQISEDRFEQVPGPGTPGAFGIGIRLGLVTAQPVPGLLQGRAGERLVPFGKAKGFIAQLGLVPGPKFRERLEVLGMIAFPQLRVGEMLVVQTRWFLPHEWKSPASGSITACPCDRSDRTMSLPAHAWLNRSHDWALSPRPVFFSYARGPG